MKTVIRAKSSGIFTRCMVRGGQTLEETEIFVFCRKCARYRRGRGNDGRKRMQWKSFGIRNNDDAAEEVGKRFGKPLHPPKGKLKLESSKGENKRKIR